MEKQEEKNNIVVEADVKEENNSVAVEVAGDNSDSKKPFLKKNFKSRKPRTKPERQKSEFDQKIIDIRRVTRVVKGGRRFSFSVAMILGNRKGSVGVGLGKASDTSLAIDKAMRDAKRKMVRVKLTKDMTIPHEVGAKYCASDVVIRPAKGRGVVAGSSLRSVLELAGVKEVGGKVLSRSKNKINNARAAIKALSKLK
ncbi:30S ribosomal protein S5 [Candidatus Campbellbacteria bacterium RIFCSPLOWO2_01_FULL_34_15]|jgi:small subunit ribosomal protein S5|uniref:Small ribosomal subunit protein uS5 n=2 Tax=Candidatus Campbelliibacteriota TaxID=1752727 RepID=A0A1F5EPY4_9BACT|nr:MAG: 30S ribosomal protein S5 [Candidatus Campbellbacteria bacterium RIFCSPLOWO2_01_FULL_34_15]OGD69610.1 MAG: 30S ribosomal protein S5 [Candidatus Campbellbacteria bacterium RIFCSPHIGHO2_01_FULL_34_10]